MIFSCIYITETLCRNSKKIAANVGTMETTRNDRKHGCLWQGVITLFFIHR